MRVIGLSKSKLPSILCCLLAVAVVTGLAARGFSGMMASTQKRQLPIYNVELKEKKIAISFDAAWGNEQTQQLIEILAQYHIHSTFFVVGDWVDRFPDSVKSLSEAGHEVSNHSDTHPHMPKLSRQEMTEQILKCNNKIKEITGAAPTLFRAPYGDYNNQVLESARELGMYTIQWNVDSLDWKNPTPKQMLDRVISQTKPGSILLFHNGAINTPTALPKILEKLLADGYSIVPVSELIRKENYTIDNAGVQRPVII